MKTGWLVRAGRYETLFNHFEQEHCVAIGWPELGDLLQYRTQDELQRACEQHLSPVQLDKIWQISAMAWRFSQSITKGDLIVSYCSKRREYILCEDQGEYSFDPGRIPLHPHLRKVRILGYKKRDALKVTTRNSVGRTAPLFRLDDDTINDLLALPGDQSALLKEEPAVLSQMEQNLEYQSLELVKDKLSRFDQPRLQTLLCGLFDVAGFGAEVIMEDGGNWSKLAISRDGMSLSAVSLAVLMHKHQPVTVSDVQDVLDASEDAEQGILVTIGYLDTEAKSLVQKQQARLKVWDISVLAHKVLQHYDNLNAHAQALLPLSKVYWPTV
ncbi:Uncharacterised protein [BD1-7 clade bacterium]|uniref:Restriction endonuclease type IV Mrr domain-containing protein n=1 Tax=BD1-7 clade bacterium TaxID=2029982 RepID=A0A5S9N3S5_9GAMM|nr:Uncharacterised protein [BD1-7 clade bacterium]CAA0083366.1 Uncharacterised protein [BD1-7 clade bacterium]